MDDPETRIAGVAALLGGFFLAVSAIPAAWYGIPPLDSHVFDPPAGSPLWVHRTVMPTLAVVGVFGLFVGLLGLLRRDWPVAGRLRRMSGAVALLGLGGLTVTTPLLTFVTFGDAGASTLAALAVVAVGGASVLIFVPALLFLAVGYVRTPRPTLGYALGGVVLAVPIAGYLAPVPSTSFATTLPVAAAAAIVGHDLFHRPDPLPSARADETVD